MCGIIAVVRRPSTRETPTAEAVIALVADQAARLVPGAADLDEATALAAECPIVAATSVHALR